MNRSGTLLLLYIFFILFSTFIYYDLDVETGTCIFISVFSPDPFKVTVHYPFAIVAYT